MTEVKDLSEKLWSIRGELKDSRLRIMVYTFAKCIESLDKEQTGETK